MPASTDLGLFAPLGCGVQTGAGSVLNTLDVQKGQSLAIFGVGSVGLSALMAGKIRGANPLIAVDLDPARLELSRELGATHTLLASDTSIDITKEIASICQSNGVSRAVDCSGSAKVVGQMIQSLGSRGKAATVGAPSPGTTVAVDIFNHLLMGRQYVGCCEGDSVPEKVKFPRDLLYLTDFGCSFCHTSSNSKDLANFRLTSSLRYTRGKTMLKPSQMSSRVKLSKLC